MNLRLALRQLTRSPGFTLLAVITLGLGIGANTAMFSVLNGIMFKPLPFADTAQLDRIYRATPQNPDGNISPADFLDLLRAKDGYGDVAAYSAGGASLSEPGQPAEIALPSASLRLHRSSIGRILGSSSSKVGNVPNQGASPPRSLIL